MWKLFKIILILFLLTNCSEKTDFDEEDAKRNTFLYPFVENEIFIEGYHVVDKSELYMAIEVESAEKYFMKIDSLAQVLNWSICGSNSTQKVLIKNIPYSGNRDDLTILKFSSYNGNKIGILSF